MIIEERIYVTQAGGTKEWLDYYEKHGWPVQQRYLGRCIGFFVTDIGTLNQIVHLWVYDDLAHRDRCRVEMNKDPQWQAFVANQPRVTISQEARIMRPVSFSPLQ